MPKAKNTPTPKEQRERFEKTVRDMIDAGELNPTEADNAMEKVMRSVRTKKEDSATD
jgi:polyhydroxyalkanoate synthesis regulator phasin